MVQEKEKKREREREREKKNSWRQIISIIKKGV